MDMDSILTIILASVPAITSVMTGIGVLYKVFKNFNDLKKEVRDRTDLNEFREKLNRVLEENCELKETITKLIEYSKTHPVIKSKED